MHTHAYTHVSPFTASHAQSENDRLQKLTEMLSAQKLAAEADAKAAWQALHTTTESGTEGGTGGGMAAGRLKIEQLVSQVATHRGEATKFEVEAAG